MKFRKAVWRDCFQAHWDSAHRDIPMPAATAALLQLSNDEAEWCSVIARGGKAKTTMRKRAAAISQAEGGEENRKKRAPQEESKAAANEGA